MNANTTDSAHETPGMFRSIRNIADSSGMSPREKFNFYFGLPATYLAVFGVSYHTFNGGNCDPVVQIGSAIGATVFTLVATPYLLPFAIATTVTSLVQLKLKERERRLGATLENLATVSSRLHSEPRRGETQ